MAASSGMSVTGVTKATCGDPEVARAMLAGGAASIGDSRIENLRRMREAGIDAEMHLLRTPMLSEVRDVAKWADVSLNSEPAVVRALARAAKEAGLTHRVILMVEMGELREGLMKDELEDAAREAQGQEGLALLGIGMNLACLSGVVPTPGKMREFESLAEDLEKRLGLRFELVGGGNSANIPILDPAGRTGRTNNLRVGEGILLGLETVNRTPIPGTRQDAFTLEAELIELKEKPTMPDGETSQNAFGETPQFEDRGIITRGILALGRQDVIVEGLTPLDQGVAIIGSSSDHVVLEMSGRDHAVGAVLRFGVDYGALVHLCTSPYVVKVHVGGGG
jgi:predicted amino acid racemase